MALWHKSSPLQLDFIRPFTFSSSVMTYATADDLPPELWQLIADELLVYIPPTRAPNQLAPEGDPRGTPGIRALPSKYMGVNRHFFHFYLDTKYREVKWAKLDERMLAQLDRLQSPIIGSHVRRLHIRAWFIDHLMRRDDQATASSGIFASTLESLQSKLLLNLFTKGSSSSGGHQSTMAQGAKDKFVSTVSSKFVLRLMISAIHNMRNVVSYSFELRDLALTKETERFLTIARLSLASSLRKLALHTTIFKFKSIATLTDFDHLEELELHLDYHGHSSSGGSTDAILASKEREARELQETIVPFINSRKETLRSLTLVCYASVNLTHFFRSIGPFPRLHSLSIKTCLDEKCLSDVNALTQFLQDHRSSLLHLDIRSRVPDLDDAFVSADDSIERKEKAWGRVQRELVNNGDVLTSLEGLHLPVGNLDLCLQLIHRATPSITHLSLTDNALDEGGIQRVLTLFSNKPFQLKSILLEIRELSIDILKLLASRLPGLDSLVLLYEKATVSDVSRMFDQHIWDPLVILMQDLKALEDGQLDWNVQHITIIPKRNASLSEEDASLLSLPASSGETETRFMKALSQAIPSIKDYRGIRWHRDAFVH